jgi:hypothetical protein
MTALSQTFYSLALFSALLTLWQWVKRRRRLSNSVRRAIEGLTRQNSD